jgi:hypothetical protein
VASASVPFELPPPSTDFNVSPLILSSGLVPLTRRPGPTDPFVFGTEKPIKVEPKGDHNFSKQDSLWYFYAVSNPGQPAGTPAGGAAAPAPAATPSAAAAPAPGATAPGAPAAEPAAAAPAPKPRIMTRINVQRDGQDAFAPFTGPAELQAIGPNYYATGSEIPLASFEPGYYTFMINVRDLNAPRGSAANKGIDRKQDFVVLMPDGSMPAKKAGAAAAGREADTEEAVGLPASGPSSSKPSPDRERAFCFGSVVILRQAKDPRVEAPRPRSGDPSSLRSSG